ncbi:MAG: sigma-54-dependent Fis family transcriptional regulator, partial [Phycisphaerae bacterium]
MSLLSPEERAFAAAVARAAYCNPFAPDRIAAERQALGGEFVADGASWNVDVHSFGHHANITRLTERTGALATACRERLEVRATAPSDADLRAYEDVALFFLYHRHYPALTELLNDRLAQPAAPARPARVACYADFARDVSRFFDVPGLTLPAAGAAPHLFACFFQLRRAFHYTFTHIVGSSDAAWRLRAAVWESIFTHDLRRYRTAVYPLMGDITTLVTGPSGTGKELVARAIGLARYVPFDPKSAAFAEDFLGSFHALSLSALSPTLI